MASSYSFDISERVRARSDYDIPWMICKVIDRYYTDDNKLVYELLSSNGSVFREYDDRDWIRKYKEKPIDHIKQSIEYGDGADDINNLISSYKMNIAMIYKPMLESCLIYGNIYVFNLLDEHEKVIDFIEKDDDGGLIFDEQGRQLIHLLSLKKDNEILNESFKIFFVHIMGYGSKNLYKALDGKNKSFLHYLVVIDNYEYLQDFFERGILLWLKLFNYNDAGRKVSILEWPDKAGKTPIDYAILLKKTKIFDLLSKELVQANISFFLDDLTALFVPNYSERTEDLIVSVDDIEVIRSRYSNTNFDILSTTNESSVKFLALYVANKGLCSILKYLFVLFPNIFNHFDYSSFYDCNIQTPGIDRKGDMGTFEKKHQQILDKLGIPNNLLLAATLGDIRNNISILACKEWDDEDDCDYGPDDDDDDDDGGGDSIWTDPTYKEGDSDDGFDYFKEVFDTVLMQSTSVEKMKGYGDLRASSSSVFRTNQNRVERFYKIVSLTRDIFVDISDDCSYSEYGIFYDSWVPVKLKLKKKYKILNHIYVFSKVNRLNGIKVQERKETLMFLTEHFDLKWEQLPPLSFFIEIGQEYLLFDWLDLNLPVCDKDLACLSEDRNRKVFSKSQLSRSDLCHLTKGQFMLFYSVLVDEIGSFVSLIRNDSIENKLFSLGMYTNLLHFSIAMKRVSLSKWFATHCPKHVENFGDKICIADVAVFSNSYPILKYIIDLIAESEQYQIRNLERLLKLASLSINDEIRSWEESVNLKYEFLSICAIREESVFTQRQMRLYLEQTHLEDKLFPYGISSIEYFRMKLFPKLRYLIDSKEVHYNVVLQTDDWFLLVCRFDWDDIIALVLANAIYHQWLETISFFFDSMTAKCFQLDSMPSSGLESVKSICSGCIEIIDGESNLLLSLNALNLMVENIQNTIRLEEERNEMLDEAQALHDRLEELIRELAPISKLEEVIEMQKVCMSKAHNDILYLREFFMFPESFGHGSGNGYRSLFSNAIKMRSTSYLQWFFKVLPSVFEKDQFVTLLGGLLGEAASTGHVEVVHVILSEIKQNADIDAIDCVFQIMGSLFSIRHNYEYSYDQKGEEEFDFGQRCAMFVELAGEVNKMGAEPRGELWNRFGWNCIKTLEYLNIHHCLLTKSELEDFTFSLLGIDFIIKEGYLDMRAVLEHSKNQELAQAIFSEGAFAHSSSISESTDFILKLYFHQMFNLFKLFVEKGWDFMLHCNLCLKRLNNLFWINLDVEHFYDENGRPYTFRYLEFILQKWDSNIQFLNDVRDKKDAKTYEDCPDSKQFKAIQYMEHLKSEQKKRLLLVEGVKTMSIKTIKKTLESNKNDGLMLKVKDRDQRNLLMIAVAHDRVDVVKLLVEDYNADIDEASGVEGMDLLMYAQALGSSATGYIRQVKASRIIPAFLYKHLYRRKERRKYLNYIVIVRRASTIIQKTFRMHKTYSIFRPRLSKKFEELKIFQEKWRLVIRVIDRALPLSQRIATASYSKDKVLVPLRPPFSWISEKLKMDIYTDDSKDVNEIISAEDVVINQRNEMSEISSDDEAHDHDDHDDIDSRDLVPSSIMTTTRAEHDLELSIQAFKWHSSSDESYKVMFEKKLRRLMDGDNSYAMSKKLKGTTHTSIFEAKLDKGQRILYSKVLRDDKYSFLVWRVSKHDDISSHAKTIDESFKRISKHKHLIPFSSDCICLNDNEILLDPFGNRPLQIYSANLKNPSMTKFSILLTPKEKEINDTSGSVIIFGRSGINHYYFIHHHHHCHHHHHHHHHHHITRNRENYLSL